MLLAREYQVSPDIIEFAAPVVLGDEAAQRIVLRNTSSRDVTWVISSLGAATLADPQGEDGSAGALQRRGKAGVSALSYPPFRFDRQSGSLGPAATLK